MCLVTITITADSFLLRMVRNIAALLVEVGSGRLSLSHATHLMALKDRSKLGLRPAPAHGLYLADVHY